MKSSTYYFHMKAKILADFQICISVPLIKTRVSHQFICGEPGKSRKPKFKCLFQFASFKTLLP